MIEVKCSGRAGQGAVTFSQILAIAAFHEGNQVQAMPFFGIERRGAPAFSFTRIVKGDCIGPRSQIYNPDIIVVLDPSLAKIMDVSQGIKKGGTLIINSGKKEREIAKELSEKNIKIIIIDATSIAMKIFGKDIVNTAILGALAKTTGIVKLESVYKGIEERFEGNQKLIDLNKQAVKEVFSCIKCKK